MNPTHEGWASFQEPLKVVCEAEGVEYYKWGPRRIWHYMRLSQENDTWESLCEKCSIGGVDFDPSDYPGDLVCAACDQRLRHILRR